MFCNFFFFFYNWLFYTLKFGLPFSSETLKINDKLHSKHKTDRKFWTPNQLHKTYRGKLEAPVPKEVKYSYKVCYTMT